MATYFKVGPSKIAIQETHAKLVMSNKPSITFKKHSFQAIFFLIWAFVNVSLIWRWRNWLTVKTNFIFNLFNSVQISNSFLLGKPKNKLTFNFYSSNTEVSAFSLVSGPKSYYHKQLTFKKIWIFIWPKILHVKTINTL